MMHKFIITCFAIFGAVIGHANIAKSQNAVTPAQVKPQIEHSARKVGRALRCVVCQNQSIDESDAPLAADMRKIVRERLSAGQSEQQVIEYMRESYGDYVLLKPPVQRNTALLWALPFLLVLLGLFWFFKPVKNANDDSDDTPS